MNERVRSLPDGWRWVRLGNVCQQDRRIVEPGSDVSAGLPYLSLEHVESNTGRIFRESAYPVQDEGKSTTFAFDPRHVLYGKLRPYLNKVALPEFSGRCTTEIIPLLPRAATDRCYLAWLLRRDETVSAAMRQKTGSRMPRADMDDLFSLEIPLAPLEQQKRIAAILNEQMGAVERARAAAEAQLEAAKALPAAYLCAVFNSPEAQKWPMKSLGEICRDISDGTHFTPVYVSSGIPFLSVKDVKETGLSFNDCRYISDEQHRELIRRCNPERGDVLYTKVGTTGIAKAIATDRVFSIFVSVALLKLTEAVLPEFLEKALNSPLGRTQAANLTQGMANRNLVIQDLKRIRVPTPPLPDQKRSADILNDKMASAERTRKAIEEELDAVNKLPAALLRRAFSEGL
ncbi:MAG: restriction endonuclease subunit S [Terriglobia bacterium]